jgi:hypothetical protein
VSTSTGGRPIKVQGSEESTSELQSKSRTQFKVAVGLLTVTELVSLNKQSQIGRIANCAGTERRYCASLSSTGMISVLRSMI